MPEAPRGRADAGTNGSLNWGEGGGGGVQPQEQSCRRMKGVSEVNSMDSKDSWEQPHPV